MQVNPLAVSYYGMGKLVREYRANMSVEHKDEIAQLQAARQALTQAHKTGDKSVIESARQAVADLEQQITDNRAQLKSVHDDVALVRTARQQLAADVKAGVEDAIPQDIAGFNEARDKVFTDIQA